MVERRGREDIRFPFGDTDFTDSTDFLKHEGHEVSTKDLFQLQLILSFAESEVSDRYELLLCWLWRL